MIDNRLASSVATKNYSAKVDLEKYASLHAESLLFLSGAQWQIRKKVR